MFRLLLLFVFSANFLFCADIKWYMEGGAHPDTNVSIRGLALSSPAVVEDTTIASYKIGYPAPHSKTRAQHVEGCVARILTDGRYSPSRNGYKITEISGKYEGDSGIDGLFKVTLNEEYFYYIESRNRIQKQILLLN
jgi:hypothetical protein